MISLLKSHHQFTNLFPCFFLKFCNFAWIMWFLTNYAKSCDLRSIMRNRNIAEYQKPCKWHLRNKRRNSLRMTCHFPHLGSASDWLNQISHTAQPIRSGTQIRVVTRHQYGISAPVSQMSFGKETSSRIAKCPLFSQATPYGAQNKDASAASQTLLTRVRLRLWCRLQEQLIG